jgi:hypothetical protein
MMQILFHMATPVKSVNEVQFMSIFRRPDYQSEVTQFIDQLKARQPDLEARQRAGRALLWDKNVDRSAWSEYREAQVPQQPYVYQTQSK